MAKRARTQGGSLPTHRGTLPAPGVFAEKSWLQVCWDALERGEDPAHSVDPCRMLWIWSCGKANVRAKGGIGPPLLLTCRSWQMGVDLLCSGGPCSALWPSAEGQFITHVPEVGRLNGDGHQGHWARVQSHRGTSYGGGGSGHLVDSGLLSMGLQGRVGVRSGLPLILHHRCRGQGHEGIASHGGA